jgi:hypothetical protein
MDRHGGESVIEKAAATVHLRGVPGAPDSMLQFDHADRRDRDWLRTEDATISSRSAAKSSSSVASEPRAVAIAMHSSGIQ